MPLGIEVFGPVAVADVEPARTARTEWCSTWTLVLPMVALVAILDQPTTVRTGPILVFDPLTWGGPPVH